MASSGRRYWRSVPNSRSIVSRAHNFFPIRSTDIRGYQSISCLTFPGIVPDYLFIDNCLEQYVFLLQLGRPSKYDFSVFQCWLQNRFPLTGEDKNVWDGPRAIEDLVALCRRDVDDIFSKFFLHRLIPVFHWTLGKYLKKHPSSTPGLSEYNDERLLTILQVVITVISSIFPISSIVILYFVNSMPARLGIAAAYTALFSFALALLTRARRVEIFAATAA
jgi:hypothetical protein